MRQTDLYTLHELLGSLIMLRNAVDKNLEDAVESMCEALRIIVDHYPMEE